MRFYTQQHPHYCGIDLHARTMYLCILNQNGAIVLHRNMKAEPDSFLKAIGPYRDQIVVAVECIFTWYWMADLCAREGIAFVADSFCHPGWETKGGGALPMALFPVR